ncbi:uncharacterized protein EV420DRAFT_1646119 [Desarmillaria tabescens]|uniref:T6SS Phospholipase effector Tle1-like catalytic domain-containing protein n=1 Tax=Armillaria tabescens TaxID=1929756 RepID=A0AA39K1E9_ARMTA|nr:uncharacterized protein EV420DRAFT_1646119 [Desarmillaria tabescens]KAK0451389.1 hypothetical protein EV420DRAFT_1646119 [Desarmillaria tabescens]
MAPPSVTSSLPSAEHSPESNATAIEPLDMNNNQPNTRICKCRCDPDCNCSCPCSAHCTCKKHKCNKECPEDCEYKCKKDCGSRKSFRNLVVCIDGTSKQFGHRNTNVIELCNRILKDGGDVRQVTFYCSGIGTRLRRDKSLLANCINFIDNKIDLMTAWNLKRIVREAYQWLVDHYKPGDRIYLFGFSRGAYQVRVLAGMIKKIASTLGLAVAGNKDSIFLAYELYVNKYKGRVIKDEDEAEALAANFKDTFSRNIKVHFVGTLFPFHICYFRHALALDERRVKFLPEFLAGGRTPQLDNEYYEGGYTNVDVDEVWFMGTHGDIGGSAKRRHAFDLSRIPLLWMEHEASETGLRFSPRETIREWKWDHLQEDKPTKSLSALWWVLECLPIRRFKYTEVEITTRKPNLGRGRSIAPRQRIHASVVFKNSETYTPAATFIGDKAMNWASLVGIVDGEDELKDLSWADEWEHMLEMDLFDDFLVQDTIRKLKGLRTGTEARSIWTLDQQSLLLRRLSFMALSKRCAKQISSVIGDLVAMLSDKDVGIRAASASCLFQLAKHWYDQQILNAKAGSPLRQMLHSQAEDPDSDRVASLQCLSHLILDPEEDRAWFNIPVKSTKYYKEARCIVEEKPEVWSPVLMKLITESPKTSDQILGLSCLARLAKICLWFFVIGAYTHAYILALAEEIRKTFITEIGNTGVQRLAIKLVNLLRDIRTKYHTSIVLQRMSKELCKEIISSGVKTLQEGLMSMIKDGHPKAKGSSALCLSSYFDAEAKFREQAMLDSEFIIVLMTKLFGINEHCFPAQKGAVIAAFLKIVNHSNSATKLAEPKVIKAIVKTLSVDRWLEKREASNLLVGILSGEHTSDEVKKSIIEELATVGVDDDALYRTQVYFRELYECDKVREFHSRENALQFLKRIIENNEARMIMTDISFPDTLAALGQNACSSRGIVSTVCSTFKVFVALCQNVKKGERSIRSAVRPTFEVFLKSIFRSDRGALSAVRNALEGFSLYEDFQALFLEQDIFEIIVKDMTMSILETHEGHHIDAQIAGFKCLQNLVDYPETRLMILEGIRDERLQLFDLLQAFEDEPESSKWLRRWSEYGEVLENTLKRLIMHDDAQKYAEDHFKKHRWEIFKSDGSVTEK